MNLALMAEEEVETWAATIAHSTINIALPPGEESSVEIDCTFEEELNLLNLSGHMHEQGSAFKVDFRTGEGEEGVLKVSLDPETIDNTLGVLLKYQDDIAKMKGSEAAAILRQVQQDMTALGV